MNESESLASNDDLRVDDMLLLLGFNQQIQSVLNPLHQHYQTQKVKVDEELEQHHLRLETHQQEQTQASRLNSHFSPHKQSSASKQASSAFLWNREGFTPLPSVVDSNATSEYVDNLDNKGPKSEIDSAELNHEDELDQDAIATEILPQVIDKQSAELIQSLDTSEQVEDDGLAGLPNIHQDIAVVSDRHQDLVTVTEPKSVPTTESSETHIDIEPFVPFMERLQKSQASDTQTSSREEPDSSIPQSLDEIYNLDEDEFITQVQGGASKQSLKIDSKNFDPDLHVALTPAALKPQRSKPWQKIVLVSLLCLVFGGLIAYLYLYELASFMK